MKAKSLLPVPFLVPLFLALIGLVPFMAALGPTVFPLTQAQKLGVLAAAPFVFSLLYIMMAGVLSIPFHKAIVPGKFPRDVKHRVYGARRMYGLCWGAIYYFTPLYFVALSIPSVRKIMFKCFGYRGHPDVNIAPDAWIRDLPVLRLSKGVYVANKSTVGTNMCLINGSILVDHVTLEENCMVGHMAKIGPGCVIGPSSEVGVDAAIGIRAMIGRRSAIKINSLVNHGAEIGSEVDIANCCYIGVKCRIADGLKIPSGANLPEGAELKTQEDVGRYISSETEVMKTELAHVQEIYKARLNPMPKAASE